MAKEKAEEEFRRSCRAINNTYQRNWTFKNVAKKRIKTCT